MAVPPRPAPAGPSTATAAVPAPRPASSGRGASDAPAGDPPDDRATELTGVAWIVRQVTHVPGVLGLRHGRLRFESTRGELFDGTPADLDLELGRSSRTGLYVTVGGERLRVCVVRPAGAVDPCRDLVERAADGRPATSGEAGSWAAWRSVLAPEQLPPGARARRFAFARHPPRTPATPADPPADG